MRDVVNSTHREPKFDQGRTFGPLLSFLLVNLLSKAVTAKYVSYIPFPVSFPTSWLPYKPPIYYSQNHYSPWYPVKNPYPYDQTYPTLTTQIPTSSGYDEYDSHYPEESKTVTTIENPSTIDEPVPAESNIRRRYAPKRRTAVKRPNRNRKRKRTTTTPSYYDDDLYYDDDYDYDLTTEATIRRRRPATRPPYDFYDEEDNYYDSVEVTTPRYRKKQKKKPSKNKTKNRKRVSTTEASASVESDEYIPINPHTEIVIVRQAATTTEPTTQITNGTTATPLATTTTPPQATTMNSTSTTTNSTGYGYGPSNGNEGISITYGPPTSGQYYYTAPFVNWYTNDATRNAVVKRVRDIVTFDKKFSFK